MSGSLATLLICLMAVFGAVTDGRGNTTTFGFDVLDRTVSRTNAVGNTWQFEYRALDRDLVDYITKPDGTELRMLYDARSRLTEIREGFIQLRRYQYDAESNVTLQAARIEGESGTIHRYTYDERNLLSSVRDPAYIFGGAPAIGDHDLAYDAHGRRLSMISPVTGATTTWTYDRADRVVAMTAPSGKAFSFGYDDAGRRTSVVYPNGLTTAAAFETPATPATPGITGRLMSIAHGLNASGQTGTALNAKLGTFSYSYDIKGNITRIGESGDVTPAGPRNRSYALDIIDRLTRVGDGPDPSNDNALETYDLDEEGNRLASTKPGDVSSFYVTDPANRVTEDETRQFEYDVNGNLVRKTVKATGVTWRYGYSFFDELQTATRHATPASDAPALFTKVWRYDAFGRMRTATRSGEGVADDGEAEIFHHDGNHIAVAWTRTGDASGNRNGRDHKWYTHSPVTDELLAITLRDNRETDPVSFNLSGVVPQQGESFYAHTDHQGSVRAITDDAGTIINEYSYGAYGNTETAVETLPQRFRYTGREWDADIALMHYRARVYDPEQGRFLQEDPIGRASGDNNFYRYVFNNPVNWGDPSGLVAAGSSGGMARAAVHPAPAYLATGQRIACVFGTVASVLFVTEPGMRNIKVDAKNCGASALSRRAIKRLRTVACYGVKGGRRANWKGAVLEKIVIEILTETLGVEIEKQGDFDVKGDKFNRQIRVDGYTETSKKTRIFEIKSPKGKLTRNQRLGLGGYENYLIRILCNK